MSETTRAAFGGQPFTTNVDLWLEVGDQQIELAQVGPTFIIAAHAESVPSGVANVAISVDGSVYRRSIRLIHGMTPNDTMTPIVPLDDDLPF